MNNNSINSDLIRGHIDTIILKALFEGDRYGYDIIKEIEQKTGGEYKLKQPTLYSCLKRLEEQGFTSSYWGHKSLGGRKKYYTLTDMGKQLFIKNHSDWERSRSIIDRLVSDGIRIDGEASLDTNHSATSGNYANGNSTNDFNDSIAANSSGEFTNSTTSLNNSLNNSTSSYASFSDFSNEGIEGLEELVEKEKNGNNGLFDGEANNHFYQNFENEDAVNSKEIPQTFYDNFQSNEANSSSPDDGSTTELSPILSEDFVNSNDGIIDVEGSLRELNESESDPNHLIRKEDFTKSTYELSADSSTLTEVIVGDYGHTNNIDSSNFDRSNNVNRSNTDKFNELIRSNSDDSSDFDRIYSIESDRKFTTNEDFYQNQKNKPSYIDEVENEIYVKPAPKKHFQHQDYYDDDELPYEELLKQQYGQTDDSLKIGGTDVFSPDNNTHNEFDLSANSSNNNEQYSSTHYTSTTQNSYSSQTSHQTETSQQDNGEFTYSHKATEGDINATVELPSNETSEDSGYDVNELKPDQHTLKEDDQEYSQFLKYDSANGGTLNDNDIVSRDYRNILSKLIREQPQKSSATQEKPQYSDDPYLQRKLTKTEDATMQLGDKMIIRKPNNSIKEYNSENFYFSNKLKLAHYFILFIFMLIETSIFFAIAELGLHKGIITSNDRWIYLGGVLVSFTLPVIALFMAGTNYNKRKKIDLDFKSSIGFRLILTALICLIVALINVYLKITTKPFTEYLASFLYPMLMALNIVFSLFIFKPLLKSKKFNCH